MSRGRRILWSQEGLRAEIYGPCWLLMVLLVSTELSLSRTQIGGPVQDKGVRSCESRCFLDQMIGSRRSDWRVL